MIGHGIKIQDIPLNFELMRLLFQFNNAVCLQSYKISTLIDFYRFSTYLLDTTVNSGGGGGRGAYSAGLCLLSEGFVFFGRLWFINLVALCSAQNRNIW